MRPPPEPLSSPDAPGLTSLTLLDRVKANDPEAWQRLVHLYGPLVFGWCRRWQLGPEDAADMGQDVFQAVATHIGSFRHEPGRPSFRAWLWTITRNKINDHFRRRQSQPIAAGGTTAQLRMQEIPEQAPDDEAETTASAALVHRALDLIRGEFEDRTWQMFWRSAVQGHAPRDIAAELRVTPDAVRMAKSRVLRRLREELGE